MNHIKITTIAQDMLTRFKQNNFADDYIAEQERTLRKIVEIHKQNGSSFYDPKLVMLFVAECEKLCQHGAISQIRCASLTKAASNLSELYETGTMSFKPRFPSGLSTFYESVITAILSNDAWSVSRRSSIRSYSMPFFKWLESEEYHNFDLLDDSIIKKYLLACCQRMKNCSLSSTRLYLRLLLGFLKEHGLVKDTFDDSLSFLIPIERKIHRPVPQSEMALVLESIDRTTAVGKRDYALILTAVVTGLRQTDIVNLKFDDFNWRKGEINVVQSKTGKMVTLPLTIDYGSAVTDYILHSRPKSSLPYIFLRCRAPYVQMNRHVLYTQFNDYRKKIGLPVCSFHGIRRALGSGMVAGGVRIDMVPDVLGHSAIEAVKPYISLNRPKMQECALDFKGIMPLSGGVAK